MAGLDVNYLDLVRKKLYKRKKPREQQNNQAEELQEKPQLSSPKPGDSKPAAKGKKRKTPKELHNGTEKTHKKSKPPSAEWVELKTGEEKPSQTDIEVQETNRKKLASTGNEATESTEGPKQTSLTKTPPNDFYDNKEVTVKALSFNKLCKVFRSTTEEGSRFVIPKKHLVDSSSNETSQPEKPECNQPNFNTIVEENPTEKPVKRMEVKKIVSTDNTVIIIVDFQQTVYFNGLGTVQVLHGEIEVLGVVLTPDQGDRQVYSPRGSSLIYLKNNQKTQSETLLDLNLGEMVREDCAVVHFKQLKNHSVDFLEKHISQKIFPPRVDFDLSGAFNLTKFTKKWRNSVENFRGKVAICGGKGVGKSTFLRYCLNRLLAKHEKVVVVDLDPGQSEFFPPGCLSVTTVREVALGPNYTHLQTPDCAVLAHINVAHDLRKYFQALKYLVNHLATSETQPILINFPGFTRGIGLDLTVKALKWLQPNAVVEIKSKTTQKNYSMDLTTRNVNRWSTTVRMLQENENLPVHFEYFKLDSLAEGNGAWSLEARQAREFCVLSYFGRMTSASGQQLTSAEIALFNINISAVQFVTHEGNPISPFVVNANVVALCSTDPNQPGLFVCQGFGLVRGLDLDNDTLVLLTPEPFERLNSVTHLVLSSVTIPPSLLMEAEGLKGPIPYVNSGTLVDFGQLTKRPYLPPRK